MLELRYKRGSGVTQEVSSGLCQDAEAEHAGRRAALRCWIKASRLMREDIDGHCEIEMMGLLYYTTNTIYVLSYITTCTTSIQGSRLKNKKL